MRKHSKQGVQLASFVTPAAKQGPSGAPEVEVACFPCSRCVHQFACQTRFLLWKPSPQFLQGESWYQGCHRQLRVGI